MLLDSTDGSPAEKDAMPNQSPRGMDVVARVKDKLEKSKGMSGGGAGEGTDACRSKIAVAALTETSQP
ncbi:hypothetical protein ZWY2020_022340 [Hordeum vulgare]|nr:hypothetical protein ZWY2020_022340 [Hordeum vulgare]